MEQDVFLMVATKGGLGLFELDDMTPAEKRVYEEELEKLAKNFPALLFGLPFGSGGV